MKQVVAEGKRCAGHTFSYLLVYYTPIEGFRGEDSVEFSLTAPGYAGLQHRKRWGYTANLTIN